MTIVLLVGVVVAFAQTAPAVQGSVFFLVVQDWPPLRATAAIAPFVLALILAGPVAGMLLVRCRPRTLIAGGMVLLGIGDMAFVLASPSTPYLWFILRFLAIGAGFVVATTVRTAVIFASVPRRLPATAAALNETSLLVGGQMGVVVVTTLIAEFAMRDFLSSPSATGWTGALPAPRTPRSSRRSAPRCTRPWSTSSTCRWWGCSTPRPTEPG